MGVISDDTEGLAHGIVDSTRVIAFGTRTVAPAASVVTVLVVMVSCAGFASPLVVLITFAALGLSTAAWRNRAEHPVLRRTTS